MTETIESDAKPFVCEVEGCGKSFSRVQGLGRHMSETHGATPVRHGGKTRPTRAMTPPPPAFDPDSYEGQVKLQLQALAAPLKAQAADIDAKISELTESLRDLRKARAEVTSILVKLDPDLKPTTNGKHPERTGTNAGYHAELLAKKADTVAEILATKGSDLFPEGFTANLLAEQLTDSVPRGLSTKSAAQVIDILRERSIVRADRVTRGGGMNFVLVGKGE